MIKRIAAITCIFICSWIAWAILTAVTWIRTDEKRASVSDAVGELWGSEHTQMAPDIQASWTTVEREQVSLLESGWEPVQGKDGDRATSAENPLHEGGDGLLGRIQTQVVSQKIVAEEMEKDPDEKRGASAATKNKPLPDEPSARHFRVTQKSHLATVMPEATSASVDLKVDYRKKGLLWFSTYGVVFSTVTKVTNPTDHAVDVKLLHYFPSKNAMYDNMSLVVQGDERARVSAEDSMMSVLFTLPANATRDVAFSYRSRGMDRWSYSFGHDVKMVENFELSMTTNFEKIDFPQGSISPDLKVRDPGTGGYRLEWDKKSVVSGLSLGMLMPHRINPGPLAQSMSLHAPVSLFFFFFVMFILQILRSIKMHPMNYFFIAASFFAFNLLFSYLVDHMDVFAAFGIASMVSIFLVISYLRIVVGLRFALVEAGISQLIYQVLFGLAHFLEEYTGLTITIGAIVTLAIVMHLTARTDWDSVFRFKKSLAPAPEQNPFIPSV